MLRLLQNRLVREAGAWILQDERQDRERICTALPSPPGIGCKGQGHVAQCTMEDIFHSLRRSEYEPTSIDGQQTFARLGESL